MSKKLLIVDDCKMSRIFIGQHVKAAHPDWVIQEAASGEEAITLIENELPDFCTMDINMPGMLGTEAAKLILAAHPDIRLVIFSANVQESYQNEARELGTILVPKPVTKASVGLALDYFLGA